MSSRSVWMPEVRAVLTQLTGTVTTADVEAWAAQLDRTLARIPDGTQIVVLANLHGYEPADLDAHRAMRGVIPSRLAALGFRTALADAVGAELVAAESPRVHCERVAHVHHDAGKMSAYDAAHGSRVERFFSDAAFANEWLLFD